VTMKLHSFLPACFIIASIFSHHCHHRIFLLIDMIYKIKGFKIFISQDLQDY
jgi:hypothetical protein